MGDFEPELPDFEEDPIAFLQEGEQQAEPEGEDPPAQRDLQSLAQIGHLLSDFDLWGHSFCIRTLLPIEEFIAASVIEKYGGTLSEGKAFAAATIAAAVVTVDGQPLSRPLGDSAAEIGAAVLANFNHITTTWHWPVIERIYEEYSKLVLRQDAALKELEGKS